MFIKMVFQDGILIISKCGNYLIDVSIVKYDIEARRT